MNGPYRYSLYREWDYTKKKVGWLMLNPSTADGIREDATTRKCIGFSNLWGYGGLIITNLWAWRATSPDDLIQNEISVGPMNDAYIREMADTTDFVVCAWGHNASGHKRCEEVMELLYGKDTRCLHLNKGGTPGHPLMLSYKRELMDYSL